MTKEHMINIINSCPDYFTSEQIIEEIISRSLVNDSYILLDLFDFIHKLVYSKALKELHFNKIINERSNYLEAYLDHKMYNEDSEEYKNNKEKYRKIQKEHAHYINKLSEELLYNKTVDLNYDIFNK